MSKRELSPGEMLSARYEIERPIGTGAFAAVYLAHDRKHRRRIAIKVLKPELTVGVSPARFQREISIAASLHHPHILPLFDSGESSGLIYFTMPFVEGETLRQALQRDRVLPLPRAVGIARQVASALGYAHARGILHRDIKPENILIVDGVPQVADFGVACVLPSLRTEHLTETGAVVGTPAYMSPEQWNAPDSVDERTDLYSLGCVLYETIVGMPPFVGPSAQVIMARHVLDAVPGMRNARPTVPPRLEAAVERALAKFPGDRFASLAEFATELAAIDLDERTERNGGSRIVGASSKRNSAESPRILVLPFLNLGLPGDDYFGSGLTDEIITSLSGLEGLRVISATTTAQLKNSGKDVRTLRQELKVTYVLEGSVRAEGDALRVRARLVATDTEESIWQCEYTDKTTDLSALEKSISRAVVEALAIRVSRNERRRLTEHRISDARAFEYYLRARQEVYKFTGDALDRALDYLQKGLALCGDNVAIWAAMGQVYWQYINAGVSQDSGYFQKARDCADRILEIDPESPEARRLLGLLEINAKGNPQVAVDHLKAALEANPNDPESLFWLSIIYGFVGRPSTGYALAIRLLEIDPITPLHYVVPGFLDVLDGDAHRGVPWLARAHELEPGNPITSIAYGQALAMAGQTVEAQKILNGIDHHVPNSFFAGIGHLFALVLNSLHEPVTLAPAEDVIENARGDLQYSWTLAQCYALCGDVPAAYSWVENAVEHGFWNYPLLAERDPLLGALQAEPRYRVLMNSTKKKWLDFRA